ncbi:MAG: (Fe-S)-binding protein, partial [Proteobacteria bacterium]|nr:(Fe-S)-binding protein [Pseudomonadota bacterium]
RDYRLNFGSKLARTGQKFLPESFARNYKLGNIPLKNFPKLNRVPFRTANETVILPDKAPVGTVVYFTGCATNYLYDDTGSAAIGILKHMGYCIIIPKDQTCCSIPLLFHGAQDKAFKNILTNIKVLKDLDADAILVDCSTCGEALKNEYPRIIESRGQNDSDAKKIAAKVIDVLTFIDQQFDRLEFDSSATKKISVTYHAPCHSKNTFQSHINAENLLKKLPNVNYKPAPDMDECCGGGGTFFYEYPKIAKKMVDKKIKAAKDLQVTHWLTDCPVCRLNLAGNLTINDRMQVLHPVTLIYSALKSI